MLFSQLNEGPFMLPAPLFGFLLNNSLFTLDAGAALEAELETFSFSDKFIMNDRAYAKLNCHF